MRILAAAGLLALAFPASQALAWGDEGHKIVCEIAFREVADPTRQKIKALIANDQQFRRFADACTWPDHPRKCPSEHFLNVSRDAAGVDPQQPCGAAGKCVVGAIAQDFAALSSPNSDDAARLEALKYLGHWVGDVHQPLHVSFEDDRGGNQIEVEGLCGAGRHASLHGAWDTCLVEQTLGRDVSAIATRLIAEVTPERKAEWTASEPAAWAEESFRISEAAATRYCVMENGACDYDEGEPVLEPDEPEKVVAIDTSYLTANGAVVRDRLERAGVRLARLLDQALGR